MKLSITGGPLRFAGQAKVFRHGVQSAKNSGVTDIAAKFHARRHNNSRHGSRG